MSSTEVSRENASRVAGTTVRRAELDAERVTPGYGVELRRLVEQQWAAESEAAERIAELRSRGHEPIARLVERDAGAREAIAELRSRVLGRLEGRRAAAVRSRTLGGPFPNLIPDLHAGINVFARPYDFEVRTNHGQASLAANRLDGIFSFHLPPGHGGARFATAGVGLVLEAGVTGVAHVRPCWQYEYEYFAAGHWLSAHTEGAAKVVVQDAITGAMLRERTAPLWNADDDSDGSDASFVGSWSWASTSS